MYSAGRGACRVCLILLDFSSVDQIVVGLAGACCAECLAMAYTSTQRQVDDRGASGLVPQCGAIIRGARL